MELYIGGYAQGKLSYVMKQTGISLDMVFDGASTFEDFYHRDVRILNHFQLFVRNRLREGKDPQEEIESMLLKFPRLIIISDEVGNGIVPMEAEEREYRERLGRILCTLAEKAEKVERIICGIGQRLK
jgi:adenosyl cobinamide kinase/adenosyl cobinamide phosphate guanylyltransferase